MLQVTISISGADEEIQRLHTLGDKLTTFTSAMESIGEALKEYYSGTVFASQGRVLGVAWPTLAASTMLYKKKHYYQYQTTPLIASGAMQDSFQSEVGENYVIVSNTAPYFKYHQSSAPRHKIPYRPMMGINEPVKTIVRDIIKADIDAKIAGL